MNEEDEADVVVDYEGNSSDEEGPIPLSPGGNNDANTNDEPKKANDDETHHPQGESITQNNVTQKNEENQFHNNGVKSNHDSKNIENDNDGDDEEGMVKEESKTDEEMKNKTSTTTTSNNNNVNLVTSPKSPLDGELKSSRTPSTQRSDHYNNTNNTNMSMRVSKSHPQQNQSRGYYDEHRNRAKESPSFKRPRYSPREYDRRRTANREEIGIYIPPAKRKLLQQQREESKKEGEEDRKSVV